MSAHQEFIEKISTSSRIFTISKQDSALSLPACRDEKDQKIFTLARIADANAIISSDADLLSMHPWNGVLILSPKDFLKYTSD
jgi:putative PIN family toxin of toxin-antitoxin system